VHVGAGYRLRWREIETAFENRILTGDNNHIEPRRFLKDAGDVVLERVRDTTVERHDSVKVNTAFNRCGNSVLQSLPPCHIVRPILLIILRRRGCAHSP